VRFRLKVAYHGAKFHGWQIQEPWTRTVQGELTKAVAQISSSDAQVLGASRTDAGVHARGQVAAFDYEGPHPAEAFFTGLNHLTEDDVQVLSVDPIDDGFHPRHSARGKIYLYEIWTGFDTSPFLFDRTMRVRRPLDTAAMNAAGEYLVGTHDFSSFRAAGCTAKTTVRRLWEVSAARTGPRTIQIRVTGSAFLKYMVRNIVGTLLEVGLRKQDPSWMGEVLAARDRSAAGATAEPQGLTLERVFYPDW
jgi:tRNA pseudouridine38-40 synthase